MDSPNQDPPIEEIQRDTLEDFVIFCIKYEYFKRNSVQKAFLNLNKAIQKAEAKGLERELLYDRNQYADEADYGDPFYQNEDRRRRVSEEIAETKANGNKRPRQEPWNEEGGKPAKRTARTPSTPDDPFNSGPAPGSSKSENPEPRSPERQEIPNSDIDSDTSNISIGDLTPPPTEDVKQLRPGLKINIKWHYRKCADAELAKMKVLADDNFNPKEILTILSIQSITSIRPIELPVDVIRATLGYRKISIRMRQKDEIAWFEIKYMSNKNGCLVWYGDTVRHVDKYKYQSLAAKDYFLVVRIKEMKFDELKFDIEEYTPRSVPVWPFQSFFRKLHNYLCYLGKIEDRKVELQTKKFSMTIFKPHGVTGAENAIDINTVLRFVEIIPEEIFCINVWDDSQLCRDRRIDYGKIQSLVTKLSGKPQWKSLKEVHFGNFDYDWTVEEFKLLHRFETVKMHMTEEIFLLILKRFRGIPVERPKFDKREFIIESGLSFQMVQEVIRRSGNEFFDPDEYNRNPMPENIHMHNQISLMIGNNRGRVDKLTFTKQLLPYPPF